ncbi:unnamed protein product [Vitrella brassicaformis CCMP3155]|uniref:Uncharacterized protein n=1 Tax=Vitrella brassicaformis (strain CCMP3155) TaxID=1169540 RepID=A0A0G4G5S8_VITBC|nr:unnamed protein product [Vitrella brassicaformis CCMP3155]|mmetsp:Transcript_7555/g.18446  ORF Transcript_7555/g.18446 Transcript_7555/m.18446 type:complete len:230 (-) Transcript_7555:1571-2260(-)|eukprot:CEM23841.1 unnamed protein product [Vitrella brassicaformis CCMP3155]
MSLKDPLWLGENEDKIQYHNFVQRWMDFRKHTIRQRLREGERRQGYTWAQLHNYKEDYCLPKLPPDMPVTAVPQVATCELYFNWVDRCVTQGILNMRARWPLARLQICKPNWTLLRRCCKRRDAAILQAVEQWEADHVKRLSPQYQQEYVDDLDQKLRYLSYIDARTQDELDLLRLKRDVEDLKRRAKYLVKKTRLTPSPYLAYQHPEDIPYYIKEGGDMPIPRQTTLG